LITELSIGLLVGWPVAALPAAGTDFTDPNPHQTWSWDLTSGFDSYLHSYALATEDTTETLAEFVLQARLAGRSARPTRHRWQVRAEASTGTELFRQRFAGDYRLLGEDKIERLRILGNLWGRQYRDNTDYSRSSDNWEGRLEGRMAPWVGQRLKLELRGWTGAIDYRTPSTLEVDQRDLGGGVFVRSTKLGTTMWGLGTRLGQRTYADSTAIDRDSWSLEGDLDHQDLRGQGLRVYHKSQRRVIRDETVRPSAWTHWTDFSGTLVAGRGHLYLDLQGEAWQYDEETDVYFNSVRIGGICGYRWGDILAATWKIGLAAERLAAGDLPESYAQIGLRAGVEAYGADLGGSLTLEYGRRNYAAGNAALDDAALDATLLDAFNLYSDFAYWKIWLMGSWRLSPHFDLDIMANYEPESHTEQTDDSALGFGSLRLRWRP